MSHCWVQVQEHVVPGIGAVHIMLDIAEKPPNNWAVAVANNATVVQRSAAFLTKQIAIAQFELEKLILQPRA